MASLLDRILLFCVSILMFNKNQVDYIMVCLILAVIIMEGMFIYFNNKIATTVVAVIFIVISFVQPEFAAFYPLIAYECASVRQYIMIPVQMVIMIVAYTESMKYGILSKEVWTIVAFMAVAIVIGMRTLRENALREKIHNLQDEESYLKQKNKQNHEELIRKQDYEIHAATLAERNRIAREIHDHVGHMLSRSILQLGAILAINKDEKLDAPLRGLKDSLDTAMNNIRESVHDLKDDSLDLEYMVNEIIEEFNTLEIELDYDMGAHLSKELKYCFIAIVKEALTNTVKHSDGNRVSIVMREHPALYQMLIEDNGSCKKTNEDKTGIGLENMRERIGAFGGNIRFSNTNGFKIFISIPKVA